MQVITSELFFVCKPDVVMRRGEESVCVVWGVSEGRVQQGDSCREKAVPGSAGPCPEAPEEPPGGQEVKQSMVRVRGVLKNAASST